MKPQDKKSRSIEVDALAYWELKFPEPVEAVRRRRIMQHNASPGKCVLPLTPGRGKRAEGGEED